MSSVPERRIQIDLYYFLRGTISKGFRYEDIEFVDVKFEEPSIDGRPDLVVFAKEKGKEIPILVIETKRKVPRIEPKFDPFSKDVIAQAERYAMWLGAPYFATCDEYTLVLFETFKVGVPLAQRRMKDYKVMYDEKFAQMLLEEIGKFRVGIGKWLPLDDVFVQRLRSFHRFITPFMKQALIEKLREDMKFNEDYVGWLKSQLFEYSDEMDENITEQMAYLLMNKVAFYKTLETQIPTLPESKRIEAVDGKEFSETLRKYFDRVLDVNYEAIFQRTKIDEIYLRSRLMLWHRFPCLPCIWEFMGQQALNSTVGVHDFLFDFSGLNPLPFVPRLTVAFDPVGAIRGWMKNFYQALSQILLLSV